MCVCVCYTGGLFDDHDGVDLTTSAWQYSVDRINNNENILPKYRLESVIERLPANNSYYASEKGEHYNAIMSVKTELDSRLLDFCAIRITV